MQERSSFYNTYQQHPGSFVDIHVNDEYKFAGIPKIYKILSISPEPNVNDTYNAQVQETSGAIVKIYTETNIIKVNNTYKMYIHKKIFQKILPETEDPAPLEGGKRKSKSKRKTKRSLKKHKKSRKTRKV